MLYFKTPCYNNNNNDSDKDDDYKNIVRFEKTVFIRNRQKKYQSEQKHKSAIYQKK